MPIFPKETEVLYFLFSKTILYDYKVVDHLFELINFKFLLAFAINILTLILTSLIIILYILYPNTAV